MNTGAKVAAAIASGYLLGRSKKLRLAVTVGGLIAGRKIPTDARGIMQQGAQLVENNPELAKLADQVRGQLFEAARAAAITAASNRMDGLSDLIKDRTTLLLEPSRSSRGGRDEPQDAYEDEDEYDDEQGDDQG